jgi:outer membrane receptor protein involved in Fe transport
MSAHHSSWRIGDRSARTAATFIALCLLLIWSARPTNAQAPGRDSAKTRADSIARLRAVTVVATPADRAQPVSATHVTASDIRLTPANTPYELLRQTAGLEVHQQGQGPGFASDASLRGFSSDHATDIALWVDGVPINEPVNGHAEGYNDWSVLFPGGIQDIDVIHGPTSALFGNFALAGVVNVRTIERMRGTEVNATGGSFGRADAMVMTGFDRGADGGVIGIHFQREDGFRPNARDDVLHGHARLVHDFNPKVTIDGGVELYGSNWKSPGFLSEDEFAAHDYSVVSNPTDGGYKRRAQERASLRVLFGNAVWRTTAYATEGRWQLFLTIPPAGGRFEGSGSQTEEEDSRAGAGATSALTWSLPRGEVTIGAESRWDRSHYENYFTTARRRDSAAALVTGRQLSAAPFVEASFTPIDRLRVDLGARYDELGTQSAADSGATTSASHGVVSPKLGALFRVTPMVGAYANASRGFRSSDGLIVDPTLAPITEWAYEGGVKFDRAGASASAALFRADVSNEQTFDPVTLQSSNGGASRRQGLELDWRVPVVARHASVDGEWTFNDARYRSLVAIPDEGGAPIVLNGLRVFNTSKYIGAAAADFTSPGAPWRVRVSGNWVGPYSPFDRPGDVLPGYGLAHASLQWTLRSSEIDVGVRNIFGRAYPELVAGDVVSPGQPRTVFVSLRSHIGGSAGR